MTLALCCLYLLLLGLLGYVVISLIQPATRMSLTLTITLASAVGAGTMGWLLFWLSLAGFAPSQKLLVGLAGLALAGLLALKRVNRLQRVNLWPDDWEKGDGWALLPLGVIITAVALLAVNAVTTPLGEWDVLAIWGLKAKVLTHEALRPTPAYFHDLTLSYSHLDYPLLVPFLTAGAYAAMGTIDDQTGKLVSVFLDLLVVPMIYLGLRWRLSRFPAACLSAVAVLLPVLLRYAGTGCADLPLTLFYAGGILFTAKWIAEWQVKDLVLAILFGSFMAFTKNEGLVLALANGLVILGFGLKNRPRIWLGGAAFFAGLLALNAVWLSWSRSLPQTHENYGGRLLSPLVLTQLPKLKQIIPEMLVHLAEPKTGGLVWGMAAVMALLGWRAFARRAVLAVWILLALHLTSYALAYSVTPWDLTVLMPMTMDRLLLHAMPAAIFLTGWHWAELETNEHVSTLKNSKPLLNG